MKNNNNNNLIAKKERFKKAIAYLKGRQIVKTQKEIAEKGLCTESTLTKALKGDESYLTESLLRKFVEQYDFFQEDWLLNGTGEMLTTWEDLEEHNASILRKVRNKKQMDEVIPMPRGNYMMVEFEDLETSAGLLGTGDISTLPETKTRLVPYEYEKGSYLVVRISGDSMDDGTKRSLSSGDEVLAKLYTDNIDFLPIRQKLFVINTYNGSVVKQITKIDKEAQTITCHSFNPIFKDFEINFEEILQVFTVEKIVNSKIRF